MWPIYKLREVSATMCYLKLDHLYTVRMAETRLYIVAGMFAKNQVTDPPLECRDLQMQSYPNIFALVSSLSFRSWDSAVGIATGCRLDGRGFGVRVPVDNVPSKLRARPRSVCHSPARLKSPAHFYSFSI
jgi:hypothetical protein